ncbi:fluoride efflux transporter CrcB [Novosphingobium album (ex Liu et al. 2023)]|uniref:Fluoride-specific ion channel FluC n=1 Tax=Novosphingobium album (ex Liu et al. 2023) TaxID=3031130 RepID=A0ABT5WRF5_9SPHN|nr:fluoride efflux transporter CrcB [Novosphingobium album (ex Liu et al. 2023)]MDE8652628.1 fluoride efflux transporter CrcB [Novosphingobium album (ex Liu et al. 2023)]
MPQPSFLAASLLVTLGGGLGAWLRFLVGRAWIAAIGPIRASAFPWSTLSVNVIGSLAMGLLVGWLARFGAHGEGTRLFLAVGVLGGFTTFSSFSMEIVSIAERGQIGLAALYIAITVLAGVLGLVAGLALMRSVA